MSFLVVASDPSCSPVSPSATSPRVSSRSADAVTCRAWTPSSPCRYLVGSFRRRAEGRVRRERDNRSGASAVRTGVGSFERADMHSVPSFECDELAADRMARDHHQATLLCMDAYDAVDVEIGHVVPVRSPSHVELLCSTRWQCYCVI